ncbi:MAG: AAA family ATPase [Candidatus Omnitrophica bacterium]|nr:AAA family ATPase [Candidatus Omnitrophota bacterium]MBU1038582.1 AAA family ATPase [Candidatus Omnitrophota bacterium]
MYTSYWGLTEKPFENTPDPKFIYYSQQHEEAMARMLYVVREHKGAALLTGEYGCGKTLLSRVLRKELQQENKYQSVFILDPHLTVREFLREIIYQMGSGPIPKNKIDISHALNKLILTNHNAGKHTVLVVDEAQSIDNLDIFEEIRLLLNYQLDTAFLLTVILLGAPELKQVVMGMQHLVQRMAAGYHLNGLSETETKDYINHRLNIAGASKQLFAEDSFHEVYVHSYGVPRRINTICDLALLMGFSNSQAVIDRKTIKDINDDMDLPKPDAGDVEHMSSLIVQGAPGINVVPRGHA